ncbi:MAG: hypothetical protein JW953_02705 [Anaerolineae bacterium]|nr:hypothetical protein [Anaerolineae bacterium]
MNSDSKLQLFRRLVQNKSPADLKRQAGKEAFQILRQIDEACARQDEVALLQTIDLYLTLASVGHREIKAQPADFKPEMFNDLRDFLAPILQNMPPISDKERGYQQPEPEKDVEQPSPWYARFGRRRSGS